MNVRQKMARGFLYLILTLSYNSISPATPVIDKDDWFVYNGGTLQEIVVTSYNQQDFIYMSKMINAEAGGEPFLGQLAVGNVIRNRMQNRNKTAKQVTQRLGQFDGLNTKYYKRTKSSDKAAHMILSGYTVLPKTVEYFHNPVTSTDRGWVNYIEQWTYVDIYQHRFCINPKLI